MRSLPRPQAPFALFASALSLAILAWASPAQGAVVDPRTIAVPEAALEIELWDETEPSGSRQAYFRILREGRAVGRARPTSHRVELVDVRFDPLAEGAPQVEEGLVARPGNRLFLVQLFATALPELQDGIRGLGGKIHRYYTEHTLLVELRPAVRDAVRALPYVRWVGAYHPAFRVEPALREALVDGAVGEARYSITTLERGAAVQEALAETLAGLGGRVEVITAEGFRMEATVSRAALLELLHDDRVQYVDRWGGPAQTDMDVVRDVGGADYLEVETGFTGQGVGGEVLDTELRQTHQEWASPPMIHNPSGSSSGAIPHGTSVVSNVFASGVNPPARGMIPDGDAIFFLADEVSQFGGSVSRYTIARELADPAGPYRAVFQTASVGNSRTLNYTSISAEMDDVLFQHQVLHTQSQSNAGNQMSRPQAWAKNIVSVGGLLHLGTADRSDDLWDFTASIGPAADGRIKPDLAFFYDSIFSATRTSDTSYGNFGGTSSATPQTAGHFGLLYQMWHEGLWAGHGGGASAFDSRPQMITAKALMIHHAHRYDWTAGGANSDLDRFKQGWGTADVRNLFDRAGETFVLDEDVLLATGETYATTVDVGAGSPELRATLAYLDPMGTVGAGVHRINDLSLRVTSPSAEVYWGNNGLTSSNASTPGGTSNTLDTVENVFVTRPEAGTWTIEVLGDEIVQDAHLATVAIDADFALIVSPASSLFADGFESGDASAWDSVTP